MRSTTKKMTSSFGTGRKKTYTVKITFAGDSKYHASSQSVKVTVKAAKIPMPTQAKTQKAAPAKVQEKEPTRKPPVGKPVVNKDLEKVLILS